VSSPFTAISGSRTRGRLRRVRKVAIAAIMTATTAGIIPPPLANAAATSIDVCVAFARLTGKVGSRPMCVPAPYKNLIEYDLFII